MGVIKFILLVLLLFAVNGSVALSDNSSASNIGQSYNLGSAGKSFKTNSIDRSQLEKRDSDMKTGNQAELSRRKAASLINEFNLFKNSPYNIFTLYPDELKSSQLLNHDSKPVEEKFDFNGWFDSRNSRTKVFFGTLPFVSVPVSNNNGEEQDPSFISKDSVFVFWYFKRSF